MKRFSILFLIAASLFSGCKSPIDPVNPDTDKKDTHRTFMAVVSEGFASASSNIDECWYKGDTFTVWDRTDGAKLYEFPGTDEATSGSIKYVSGESAKPVDAVYGLFPANENASISSDGVFHFDLPSSYTFAEAAKLPRGANIMVAKSTTTNLWFMNVLSMLKVQLTGKDAISKVTLTGIGGECLAGQTKVRFFEDKPVVDVTGTETEIVVNYETPVQLSPAEPVNFYILLPPTIFSKGFHLAYETTEGKIIEREITQPIEIERSRITFVTIQAFEDPNATVYDPANNGRGSIVNSKTGEPIPGVFVSDGFTFCKTDINGNFQMKLNPNARFLFMTVPSDYEIPMSAAGRPDFYRPVNPAKGGINEVKFTLTPLISPESRDEFQMVMIGDPQCATTTEVGYYRNQTIPDIQKFMNDHGYNKNCFAVTLGDNIHDSNNTYSGMQASMSNVNLANGRPLPFFQAMGNHDHNALVPIEDCTKLYESFFGPTDFSFDRGNMHVIVMDDVFVTSTRTKTSSKSNGFTCEYTYGFTDEEWNWIQQDLANVTDKANKLVIFCAHIPFRSYTANHITDVLKAFTAFHEAHLMIGHTHYPQNWIHTKYKCQGGNYIYEHIHNTACGAWWATSATAGSDVIGSPRGYSVYRVQGNQIVDWVNKGTGRAEDFQLRVYDGNQEYTGSKNYPCYWYQSKEYTMGSNKFTVKGSSTLKDCFVAQIWDDDDSFWTVELFINGTKVGNFSRMANSTITNASSSGWYFNVKNKTTSTYCSTTASHYWYYKHSSLPTNTTNWEVRATHRFPNGSSKVYTCNKLTTDYSSY